MKISSVKAPGYSIIVEMLNEGEVSGSTLILSHHAKESNHAFVKDVGPLVDEKSGLKAGDLVIVQGNYIPVPNPTDNQRKWGSVELHAIKAVLTNSECCSKTKCKA